MIDAKAVKEIATKYIYDKCPAIAAIGESTICQRNSCHYLFIPE